MAQIAIAGTQLDSAPLFAAAKKAAELVKRQAAIDHVGVAISVGRTNTGVRIVVRGPGAGRYRAMVNKAIYAQMPHATDLVRASILKAAKL